VSISPAAITNTIVANPSVTINTTGFTGGGTVALGGTLTIAAPAGGVGVTSISAGTGITCTPNPITATGSVAVTNVITAGTYTNPTVNVNAQGQITSATNGGTTTSSARVWAATINSSSTFTYGTLQSLFNNPSTSVGSRTIAANTLSVGSVIRFQLTLRLSNVPSGALNLNVNLGSATAASFVTGSEPTDANLYYMNCYGMVTIMAATSGSLKGVLGIATLNQTSPTSGSGLYYIWKTSTNTVTQYVDLTTALLFDVLFTYTGSGSNFTIITTQSFIWVLP
jgi:hypothetical protein